MAGFTLGVMTYPPQRSVRPRRVIGRLARWLGVGGTLGLAAGLSVGLQSAAWAGHPRWVAPLDGPLVVLRPFDPPDVRWGSGHRGVDLSGWPDDLVRSAGAGTVTFAGPLAERGVVVVEHGELRTTYEPVEAVVSVGDVVAVGQPLGRLQPAGVHCGGASCLHWGLLRARTYLDPLALLGRVPVRLLPSPASSVTAAQAIAEATARRPSGVRVDAAASSPSPGRGGAGGWRGPAWVPIAIPPVVTVGLLIGGLAARRGRPSLRSPP